MATVYSRTWKSGKVSWYTKVKTAQGEWKPLLLRGVKSETAAKKWAADLERERERGDQGLSTAAPFLGSFAELCAEIYDKHFQHQGSAQADGSRLRQHAGDPEKGTATWLGALPARKVTGPKLAQYFAELSKTITVRGKPYSAGAINRLRANFSTVFEKATELGYWVGPNPAEATKARALIRAGHDILQAEEIAPVLAACAPYWRGCLAVGILAALRKGEIFGLKKADVDLARRILMVRRSHDRETTKGGTHAAVPIHEDLVPFLEEALESPGPWLFPNTEGGQRSATVDLCRVIQMALVRAGFIERWERCCRRKGCGFRDEVAGRPEPPESDCERCGFRLWLTPRARTIRWHEGTRHTLASHALMAGASLQGVQAILRHADPRLTIQTYGHLSVGFLGQEVNRVDLGLDAVRTESPEPTEPSAQKVGQPLALAAHKGPSDRGARMVRVPARAHQRSEERKTERHEESLESEWSRRVSNSRPMHCERIGQVSPLAATRAEAFQVTETTDTTETPHGKPIPSAPPRPEGRGAPMVRSEPSTHQKPRSALVSGRPSSPEGLLTLRQVAEQLRVGRTWVRRRIESGELASVQLDPRAPRMVRAEDLRDYLARFPGVTSPTAPVVPETAPRARKGAA